MALSVRGRRRREPGMTKVAKPLRSRIKRAAASLPPGYPRAPVRTLALVPACICFSISSRILLIMRPSSSNRACRTRPRSCGGSRKPAGCLRAAARTVPMLQRKIASASGLAFSNCDMPIWEAITPDRRLPARVLPKSQAANFLNFAASVTFSAERSQENDPNLNSSCIYCISELTTCPCWKQAVRFICTAQRDCRCGHRPGPEYSQGRPPCSSP